MSNQSGFETSTKPNSWDFADDDLHTALPRLWGIRVQVAVGSFLLSFLLEVGEGYGWGGGVFFVAWVVQMGM